MKNTFTIFFILFFQFIFSQNEKFETLFENNSNVLNINSIKIVEESRYSEKWYSLYINVTILNKSNNKLKLNDKNNPIEFYVINEYKEKLNFHIYDINGGDIDINKVKINSNESIELRLFLHLPYKRKGFKIFNDVNSIYKNLGIEFNYQIPINKNEFENNKIKFLEKKNIYEINNNWYSIYSEKNTGWFDIYGIKIEKDKIVLRCGYYPNIMERVGNNINKGSEINATGLYYAPNLSYKIYYDKVKKIKNSVDGTLNDYYYVDFFYNRNNYLKENKVDIIENVIDNISFYLGGNNIFSGKIINQNVSLFDYDDYSYIVSNTNTCLNNANSKEIVESCITKNNLFKEKDITYETLKNLCQKDILPTKYEYLIYEQATEINKIEEIVNLKNVNKDLLSEKAFQFYVSEYSVNDTKRFIELFPNSRKISMAKSVLLKAEQREKQIQIEQSKMNATNKNNVWTYKLKQTDYFETDTGSITTFKVNIFKNGTLINSSHYYKEHFSLESGDIYPSTSLDGDARVVIIYNGTKEKALEYLEQNLKSYLSNEYNASNFGF